MSGLAIIMASSTYHYIFHAIFSCFFSFTFHVFFIPLSDVPFNMGTNTASQKVLEAVKRDPVGWGELAKSLLVNMPPVPTNSNGNSNTARGEL